MYYSYEDNPNCGRCGHLNGHGACNMTACLYPVIREDSTFVVNPITNYDRIVSKTPEELSDFLCNVASLEDCTSKCPGWAFCRTGHTGILDWLKQEATE